MRRPQGDTLHFLCGASFPRGWGGGGAGYARGSLPSGIQTSRLILHHIPREGFGRVTIKPERQDLPQPPAPFPRRRPAAAPFLTGGASAPPPPASPPEPPRHTQGTSSAAGAAEPRVSRRALQKGRACSEAGKLLKVQRGRGWPSPHFPRQDARVI